MPALSFPDDGPPEVFLLDDRTLATVGEPVTGGADFFANEVNDDGSLLAVAFGTPNRPEGNGELVVLDGMTGDERLRLTTPVPLVELTFDEFGPYLLGATVDGRLITIDLESGEVVADVALTATGPVNDMEVGADGLVTVVSSGQLEIVDRSTGVVGEPEELRGVVDSRIRPDGLILSIEPGGATSVITLDGNSLVERSYPIDPFVQVTMRDGRAATSDTRGNPFELVDLATGERSFPEFTLEDGTTQQPWAVVPDGEALWTLAPLGQAAGITRWENGTPISSVDLPGPPAPGELFEDRWAILVDVQGGQLTPHLIALDPDGPRIVMSVEVPDSRFAIPSVDGGVHVLDVDGTMFTFDRAGDLVDEIETGLVDVWASAVDPASGRVAIASSNVGVAIVDPTTGDVQEPTTTDVIVNLGFARDGQYLALTSQDGTVRLWDVERQASAGLVWDGDGARILTNSWYDETSDSIWITTSGRLIEVPLDPDVWVERACTVVGRELSEDEWARLIPGDEPQRSACG